MAGKHRKNGINQRHSLGSRAVRLLEELMQIDGIEKINTSRFLARPKSIEQGIEYCRIEGNSIRLNVADKKGNWEIYAVCDSKKLDSVREYVQKKYGT